MYRQSYMLCCCMLLFASSSDSWRNYKNDDEQSTDLRVRHDLHTNSKKVQSDKDELRRYHSRENSLKNYDKVQHESCVNSTKDNYDNDDSMRYDFRTHTIKNDEESNQIQSGSIKVRSMKANENDSASQQIYGNFTKTESENNYIVDDNDNMTFSNETCKNNTCIYLCCPLGDRLIQKKCVPEKGNYSFPDVYGYTSNDSSQSEDNSLDKIFQLIVQNPCQEIETESFIIHPNEYTILANGSLYLQSYDVLIPSIFYCFAVVNRDIYDVIMCDLSDTYPMYISISIIVSLPCLLATFIVYSILPELQNMHGYTLRAYIVSLFISYIFLPVLQQSDILEMGYSVCILVVEALFVYTVPVYLFNFSFLATFFWLNVMCFDIWWTFRKIRSSQRNVKQQERKKFILYSMYAWGSALFLDIICAFTDYVPGIPEYFKPNYCKNTGLIDNSKARSLYFYLPIGITIVSNICFFVMTTLKIVHHKRRTANDLRNSESTRHGDNKQKFIMYLKLSLVMGITWIMEIASWLDDEKEYYILNIIWHSMDMINALQGFIIFVILVCRKKIIRLLLKRLGWQNCGLFAKNAASNDHHSSTTMSETMNMEDINSRMKAN